MPDILSTITRDGTSYASHIPLYVERITDNEQDIYSMNPTYRYAAQLNYPLPTPYRLRQNDYVMDESEIDFVTTTNTLYQVINEPELWPDGHTEFVMQKQRIGT